MSGVNCVLFSHSTSRKSGISLFKLPSHAEVGCRATMLVVQHSFWDWFLVESYYKSVKALFGPRNAIIIPFFGGILVPNIGASHVRSELIIFDSSRDFQKLIIFDYSQGFKSWWFSTLLQASNADDPRLFSRLQELINLSSTWRFKSWLTLSRPESSR